mgnify:CR=1 FL=1
MCFDLLIFGIIALIAVIYVLRGFKIIPQSETRVVERLGRYDRTLQSGINYLFPIIDRAREVYQRAEIRYADGSKLATMTKTAKIDLREQVYDFDKQSVITKDNVTMQIDTVIYYAIYDAKLYAYGAVNPISALSNLAAITHLGERYIDEASPVTPSIEDWKEICPFIDVWLNVREDELRYVANILPTLSWRSGKIGIRLIYEPKDVEKLFQEFVAAYKLARTRSDKAKLWPLDFTDYLHNKMKTHFVMKIY